MQSKQHFHLCDIILLALIGIIFAVIYFGADFIYNALTVALSPIGYGPAANDITMGIWCMAGTLSGFLLRKPGAGFLGEFLAAAIETFMNGQWGAANFISGFVQGVATELGFTVTGYKIYNWLTVVTTSLFAAVITFGWDWFKNGYSHFAPAMQISLFIIRFISIFIFSGVLVKLIANLLERAHVVRKGY
ncbi:MAG: ECF transporter S component [Limosilactobacillus coleohominis]|uniref:ECF transporter S component n=1 Tax=Limosilactobacillus coleohominis TaxID=181675 RepID=UPI002A837346|nr:ECF transporter S component [Limosilactobacillus coleohominis]MCI5812481.1 ECF transporter S component [Lactobacillus sp.]MDY3702399.1 ECF transporter S component [Limosilactobacillus coleohominis]MDY5628635.1 ECF transporter S component [Limosilactobacillus coleohominis]